MTHEGDKMQELLSRAWASHHFKDLIAILHWGRCGQRKITILNGQHASHEFTPERFPKLRELAQAAFHAADALGADAVDVAHLLQDASVSLALMPFDCVRKAA